MGSVYFVLAQLSLIAAIAVFLFAAWTDFTTWKIPNRLIFMAVGCYVPYAVFLQLASAEPLVAPLGDLAAAALLFVIGFVLWAVKLFGAGDAKLFFPVGLFVGWQMLLPYALGLILFATLFWLALKWPLPPVIRHTMTGMRIDEIRTSGKVPYGVVMVAALLACLAIVRFGV